MESLWMPHWTDLVTLTIQHRWRLSLPPLENAIPRARNRLSLIIASLLRTVAPHRFHPRYWQCSLLITLSRPRIAIVASGSRALHVCMQRDARPRCIHYDPRGSAAAQQRREKPSSRIIQRFNSTESRGTVAFERLARLYRNEGMKTRKENFIQQRITRDLRSKYCFKKGKV